MTNPITVTDAKAKAKELEQELAAIIRQYEQDCGVSVDRIDLTHHLMMGYPRRVASVLLTVHL